MLKYLQRIFPLAPLSQLEAAQKLSNQLQFELQRSNEDRQRLTKELADERGAHLKEIKQVANYVTLVYGQMAMFPDVPVPKLPEPAPSLEDVLKQVTEPRREKRHDPLDDIQFMPGKGHPLANKVEHEEEAEKPN